MRTRIVQVVEPAWLDVAAAARYCSCSVPTIRRAIKAGQLQHVRVGRGLRTKREWCDRWLESGGCTGQAPEGDSFARVETISRDLVRTAGNRRPLVDDGPTAEG